MQSVTEAPRDEDAFLILAPPIVHFMNYVLGRTCPYALVDGRNWHCAATHSQWLQDEMRSSNFYSSEHYQRQAGRGSVPLPIKTGFEARSPRFSTIVALSLRFSRRAVSL